MNGRTLITSSTAADMLNAIHSESLTSFAENQQRRFELATTPEQRKSIGHFGTPRAIAEFMAAIPTQLPRGGVRILDAGAGVGMLSAAVCQRLLSLECRVNDSGSNRRIKIDAWENDADLVSFLRRTLKRSREALEAASGTLDFTIHQRDFILENAPRAKGLFDEPPIESGYDLAIMNPPYFKLRKESTHARAMASLVHGQPNMYSLFMTVACELLAEGGDLVAITPRSYFSGPYFRRFRRWFFQRMTIRQIHLFESRSEAFQEARVLQESVILWATKGAEPRDVAISSSEGRDLTHGVQRRTLPYSAVIDVSDGHSTVRVSANPLDQAAVDFIDALPTRFSALDLRISTGPVVTFRAAEHLMHERGEGELSAPLLMMHNVRPYVTAPPQERNGKPAHFQVCDRSRPLLLPARRYVLLKRFTAKEERRRLVAGIFERTDSYSPWIAVENHVNYVCKPSGELSRDEAFGLAALLNSALYDRYFRAISGNTQVNAAEIRSLPLPRWPTLRRIGRQIEAQATRDARNVQAIVSEALGVDGDLREYLEGI